MNQTREISINAKNLMPIIKKWLYSDRDIFLRELIANAVDAVTKHKKLAAMGEAEYDPAPYAVRVTIDRPHGVLTVSDNGIGMTAEETEKYLGEVAFSGAADFAQRYEKAGDEGIIGHFGLGFYSAFMVAKNVEVDTLSYAEGAQPVLWESDGQSSYSLSGGTRTARGTDVKLHLNEDDADFLEKAKVEEIIKKYCGFLPVPIYLTDLEEEQKKAEEAAKKAAEEAEKKAQEAQQAEGAPAEAEEGAAEDAAAGAEDEGEEAQEAEQPLNDVSPLWLKNPSDCTEPEYIRFYQKVFGVWEEPLFWVHLNVDYPFRLKGILYFPRLNPDMGMEGQIKLYNNQVFVADNVKEVIPEFLMLLRGVIDCPDLPLNVSRSMLQNDGTVKKVQAHITKKVADKLKDLCENERKEYERCWKDIAPYVRYGALRDEKFYEQIQPALIFETIDETFITLDEVKEAAKNNGGRMFYVTDLRSQSFYVELFKKEGQQAVLLGGPVDDMFVSFLEYKNPGLTFARIDADVAQAVKGEYEDLPDAAVLESLMKKASGNDQLKVEVAPIKDGDVLSMLVINESDRRFYDMALRYGNGMPAVPPSAKLVLNGASPVIQKLAKETDEEKAGLIAAYVYDLALIGCGRMDQKQAAGFFQRAAKVLSLIG